MYELDKTVQFGLLSKACNKSKWWSKRFIRPLGFLWKLKGCNITHMVIQ